MTQQHEHPCGDALGAGRLQRLLVEAAAGLEPAFIRFAGGTLTTQACGFVLVDHVPHRRRIEPLCRSNGVTARWAHHLPNSRWGDRRVLPPLRPGSRPGSSLLGSITMSIRQDSNLRAAVCGTAALPLSY